MTLQLYVYVSRTIIIALTTLGEKYTGNIIHTHTHVNKMYAQLYTYMHMDTDTYIHMYIFRLENTNA